MSIFKRKSKAEKAAEKAEKAEKASKKGEKDGKKPEDEPKPAQQPYKHVPTHAGADAAKGKSAQRLSREASDYAQGTANFQHPLAQNTNHSFARTMTPPNGSGMPLPPYRGLGGGLGTMQRNNSAEVFTTDPDAPPMPTAILTQHQPSGTPSTALPRNGSGYFSNSQHLSPSFDNGMNGMLGNPKLANAARDRGYVGPHTSSDSGYGSTSHSRAPSENMNLTESSRPHLPRDESGFLPELSLSEELMREPAFSEASFDETADRPLTSPRPQPESVLKNGKGYFSQLDPANDSRPVKSSKSLKSSMKQTRFDHSAEPVASRTQELQQERPQRQLSQREILQQSFLPEPVRDGRPESATIPQRSLPQFAHPERSVTPTPGQYEEPRPGFFNPEGSATPPPQHYQEPQSQYGLPVRTSTPPPAREREPFTSPIRYSSPPPSSAYAPLERVMSGGQGSLLGSLEGYKVNKRGNVLDEEGEVIGELYDGDIMDCVRQRCNAYGEVLDDRGRIVGRVRETQNSSDSPIMRVVSPLPFMHQQHQQPYQHLYQQQTQQGPTSPTVRSTGRRESNVSQPDVFTPAWQRQSHNQQTGFASELRQHLASSHAAARQPVAPIDFPGNVTAVELPARKSEEEEREEPEDQDEVLPIFDHSDAFMPPPFVPARSPRRPETPSPPPEKAELATTQTNLPAPVAKHAPARRTSSEAPYFQPKHVSAPPAPRQDQPQQQEVHQAEKVAQTSAWHRSVANISAPSSSVLAAATTTRQFEPEQQTEEIQPTLASAPVAVPAAAPILQASSKEQPTAQAVQEPQIQAQQPTRRVASSPLLRSASDSSMSDFSKSYSRPSMSPVPEDGTSDDTSSRSTGMMFAYKGDIPTGDGAVPNSRLAPPRAGGPKSPPLPSFPSRSFTGGLPGGSPFTPLNAAAFSGVGGMSSKGTPPRQFTTGVPGPRPIIGQKNSFNAPLKRSPLSSHETTPPDSDEGSYDGEKASTLAPGMHSRAASVRTMSSMHSLSGKPRTYFTHGGRVTVGNGEETPAQIAAREAATKAEKTPAPSISDASVTKKKSRFSFGLGKKN